MPRERAFRKLRLFVASPSDVGSQRDRVNRVAERLNRTGGPADEASVVLEVVRWESHVAPLAGYPQDVVLRQVQADTWDIFVGILWLRFGSPPGARSSDSGEEYGSGTEEEFDLAYQLWRKNDRPQILIYRCLQAPESVEHIDAEQLTKITQFFARFSPQGSTPGLYSTFLDWSDFEIKLEQDLMRVLALAKSKDAKPPSLDREDRGGSIAIESLADHFQEGKSYQVSVISVDVVDHSRLVRNHQEDSVAVQALMHNFFALATNVAARHHGYVFSWSGDGGLLIFEGERYRERTILAGLRLLNELTIFNLDSGQNALGEPIAIRLAAHEAPIIFRFPASSISSPDLNLVVHIQEKFTAPSEFCITDTLLDNVPRRLSDIFTFKGRFEGKPIFFLKAAAKKEEERPTSEALTAISNDSAEKARYIKSLLINHEVMESDTFEVLSVTLEQFYFLLQKFFSWFSPIDDRWAIDYIRVVSRVTSELLQNELSLWEKLRRRYVQQRRGAEDEHELEAIVQSNSSRRSRPVLSLEKLKRDLDLRSGVTVAESAQALGTPNDQIRRRLDEFIRADDLDKEIVLTDLLSNKEALIELLVSHTGHEDGSEIRKHLWSSADLVLQSEMSSHRRRRYDRQLIEVLSEEPMRDSCFTALRTLLSQPQVISADEISRAFRATGCLEGDNHLEVAWRCIAIAHKDPNTQRYSVERLSLSSIWQMIARDRLPISLIYYVGLRFKNNKTSELQKIFFDCTRGGLLEEITKAVDRTAVADLTRVMMLLSEFEFMVETTYFERFDELLTHFLQCVKQAGLKVQFFEKIRSQLDIARRERGTPSGEVPQNIRSLPLSIQRRLAGESPYLLWFIGHPDKRVAMETIRHINLQNVERVLRTPEINGEVMRYLLSKAELFGRWSVVLAALSHPKCSVEFARVYLPRLRGSGQGTRALNSIVQNSSAHPTVRSMAKGMVSSMH
jgi:class 3 adenylate cyclase